MYLYCVNPSCTHPENRIDVKYCHSCGSSLILNQRYVTIKKIGHNSFGFKLLGVDLHNKNSYCVVQQLLTNNFDKDTTDTVRNLFEGQVETLAKINHPQIPKFLDSFQDKKELYVIQEFILGRNLEKEVQKKGVFPEILAKRFLKEILPVLDYVHSQRVISGDLKPANILRRKEDNKLILINDGLFEEEFQVQSMKCRILKNVRLRESFKAPEQLAMRPVYASDIYSLGATCLYLLTGKNHQNLLDRGVGELKWEQYTNVSPNFAKLLNKMLDLDLKKRYNSAQEVIQALEVITYPGELKGKMAMSKTNLDNDNQSSKQMNTNISSRNTSGFNVKDAIEKRQQRKNRFVRKYGLTSFPSKSTNVN